MSLHLSLLLPILARCGTLCCLWGRAEPCCLAPDFKNSTFIKLKRKQDWECGPITFPARVVTAVQALPTVIAVAWVYCSTAVLLCHRQPRVICSCLMGKKAFVACFEAAKMKTAQGTLMTESKEIGPLPCLWCSSIYCQCISVIFQSCSNCWLVERWLYSAMQSISAFLLVDFYGIFSLLKAPAESDGSVPNKGDEGQTTEDQFLGEVSVAL